MNDLNPSAERAKILHERMDDSNPPAKRAKIVHGSFISEDGVMEFDLMISLQTIAATKVVTDLWMDRNNLEAIREFIHSCPSDRFCEREGSNVWKEIKKNVVAKISNLFLPKSVISELIDLVPVTGLSILNWIAYNDKLVSDDLYEINSDENSKYSVVDHVSSLTWTARGNIDYAETARNMLADGDAPLSKDQKYKIACTYCLEDEIAVLAADVVDSCYLDSVKIDMHPMVYYWTAHVIADDNKLLHKILNNNYCCRRNSDVSINEEIFRFLIRDYIWISKAFNEVAINHMWNRLSTEEKERNIKPLVEELSNQGLMYSLLSKMNYDQQQEVFKDCSDSILVNILNSSFRRKYFLPAALHVLDIMRPRSYLKILHEVACRMAHYQGRDSYLHDEYKYAFKLLWEEGSSRLKEFIKHEHIEYFRKLVMKLSWEFDMDILKLMFSSLKKRVIKHRIFSGVICDRWFNYVENGRLDLLEQFLRSILSSEGEIRYLKTRIGFHIAFNLAKRILDDETDRILDWHFESEKKKEDVRMQILRVKWYFLEASMLDNNKVDFAQFENDLKWCAKGDLNKINGLKDEFASSLFSIPKINVVLQRLIRDDKYEILNQYLNCCFSDDQVKLAQFKSTTSKELSSPIHRLAVDLFVENSPTMADKFMEWLFTNGQEVQEYKTWLLTPASGSCNKESVCTGFLIKNQFELADKVVKWCVTSDEEIAKFKRKLMMSNEVFRNCRSSEIRPHNYNLPLLIKWFNPSKELIEDFKRHVPEKECPINFYMLLDDFLKNHF